jgi:hypothetical protein
MDVVSVLCWSPPKLKGKALKKQSTNKKHQKTYERE